MVHRRKIYLIGTTFGEEESINGPAAVMMALAREFEKKEINFEFLNFVEGTISKPKFILKIAKTILKERGSIVNVHTNGFIIPFIVMLLSFLNRQNDYYLTVHGVHQLEIQYYSNKNNLNLILERLLYKYFKNIICVSSVLQEAIKEIYGRTKNSYVISNGTVISDYPFVEKSFGEGCFRMIATGGIKPIKGIYELLDVVDHLVRKKFDIQLDIYGSYDDEDKLEKFTQKVNELGLNERISYKGVEKDKNGLFRKYEEAHLNMCPSIFDTFNVSALESMVVGTPTVITKQAGAAECISDYEDGFIVDMDGDLNTQIEKVVNYIVQNKEQYKVICRNAYRNVRNFSWDIACEKYLELFYNNNAKY